MTLFIKSLSLLSKDTIQYGVPALLAKSLMVILIPMYTGYLRPEEFGSFVMLSFVPEVFNILAGIGLREGYFRNYNHTEDTELKKILGATSFYFVLFSSIVLFSLGYLFKESILLFLVDETSSALVAYIIISLINGFMMSCTSTLININRAQGKTSVVSKTKVLEVLGSFGITILFLVIFNYGLLSLFLGQMIGLFLGLTHALWVTRKELVSTISIEEVGHLLKVGLPFLPHSLIVFGTTFFIQYFIKEYYGVGESGIFNISMKLIFPLTLFLGSFKNAWIPIKFKLHKKEKKLFYFENIINVFFYCLLVIYFFMIVFIPHLFTPFIDKNYEDAFLLFPFVGLIYVFQGLYLMSITGFEYAKNTMPIPFISAIGLVAIVGMSLYLHNYIGIYAIIIAAIFSNFLMSLFARIFAKRVETVRINYKWILMVILFIIGLSFLPNYLMNLELKFKVLIFLVLGILVLQLGYFYIYKIKIEKPEYE